MNLPNDPLVRLPADALGLHTLILGVPGVGKSRLLEALALQLAAQGRGGAVIDPHGDLYDHLLSHLAVRVKHHPELAERIVLVNPIDPDWTIGFNPLAAVPGLAPERLASFMTDICTKIMRVDAGSTPRLMRLLSCTFLALAEVGLGLADIPRFLRDTDWREGLLARVNNPDVVGYFRWEYPESPAAQHEYFTPLWNRLSGFVFDPDLRLIFSARSTLHFRQLMDQGAFVLVNLSKGLLGEANAALFGAFLAASLQKASLARADTEERERQRFTLLLDEWHSYVTLAIRDALTETRKYRLAVILANQYLEQVPPDLLHAVMNATGTLMCFRVGYANASVLAHELFPPDYLVASNWQWKAFRVGRYPVPFPVQESTPLRHEDLTTLLTQLDARTFVLKRRGPYAPVKVRTPDMPTPPKTDDLLRARQELRRLSGTKFGIMKGAARRSMERDIAIAAETIDGQYRVLDDWEEK